MATRRSNTVPVRFRTTLYNVIYDVMKARGWKETEDEIDWDFHWADKQWMCEMFDHLHLSERQRVNHFRNYYELCRKDLLIKNLKRMKRTLEREGRTEEAAKYDFFPQSFVLPVEYGMFQEEFKKNPGVVWIMKPIGQCQGRGIFLFNKLQHIAEWKKDSRFGANSGSNSGGNSGYNSGSSNNSGSGNNGSNNSASGGSNGVNSSTGATGTNASTNNNGDSVETYIVQKYIDRPFLVGGKKFDLRVYCLVTSYQPLTVWLYRSAFCRFTHQRFSMNVKEIGERYIHLTNVAVQKTAPGYTKQQGCKWSIRKLKLFLMSKIGDQETNRLFADIQGVILRALFSVQKIMISDKHCFEIYGYDILIDADFKVWLLEVNASPSISAETSADYDLKFNLLNDALTLVDIEGKRYPNGTSRTSLSSTSDSASSDSQSSQQQRCGGFDLIYSKDSFILPPSNATVTSNLGTCNDLAIPSHKISKPPNVAKGQSSEKALI